MNARASLRGISLVAPANTELAREIGLDPAPAPPVAAAAPDAGAPAPLHPLTSMAEAAHRLMRQHAAPVTRRVFIDEFGKSPSAADNLMASIRLLVEHGLAVLISGRGLSTEPYCYGLTEAGRRWKPARPAEITDQDLIDTVRAINDRPRSLEGNHWWRAAMRSQPPASASLICDMLVNRGRKRTDLTRLRARLDALAAAGKLESVPIARRGGSFNFYWSPDPRR